MFDIWIRAIKPGLATDKAVDTYEAVLREEPNPTMGKGVMWMALSGVIASAISGFLPVIFGVVHVAQLLLIVGDVISVPFYTVIAFVIFQVILLLIAKVLGGQGNLDSQSYVQAAVLAPIVIIFTVLGNIPGLVGYLIRLLAAIYAVRLIVVALQAAHRYSGGRAFLTVLLPIILVICIIALNYLYVITIFNTILTPAP